MNMLIAAAFALLSAVGGVFGFTYDPATPEIAENSTMTTHYEMPKDQQTNETSNTLKTIGVEIENDEPIDEPTIASKVLTPRTLVDVSQKPSAATEDKDGYEMTILTQ